MLYCKTKQRIQKQTLKISNKITFLRQKPNLYDNYPSNYIKYCDWECIHQLRNLHPNFNVLTVKKL